MPVQVALSYSRLQNLGRGRLFFQINVFVIRTGNKGLVQP